MATATATPISPYHLLARERSALRLALAAIEYGHGPVELARLWEQLSAARREVPSPETQERALEILRQIEHAVEAGERVRS